MSRAAYKKGMEQAGFFMLVSNAIMRALSSFSSYAQCPVPVAPNSPPAWAQAGK